MFYSTVVTALQVLGLKLQTFFHQERLVKAIYFISTTNCGTSCKLQIQILGSDLAKIHVSMKMFDSDELIFYSENFCTLEKLEELQIDS